MGVSGDEGVISCIWSSRSGICSISALGCQIDTTSGQYDTDPQEKKPYITIIKREIGEYKTDNADGKGRYYSNFH